MLFKSSFLKVFCLIPTPPPAYSLIFCRFPPFFNTIKTKSILSKKPLNNFLKGEALFGVPRGRGKAAWGDGDAENTRARWHFGLKLSAGRSMIEMLGVLAVIGVLSAGGIMGYTVAMNKHHINTLIEDINLSTTKIMSFLGPQPASGTINNRTQLYNMGLITKNMLKQYKTYGHINLTNISISEHKAGDTYIDMWSTYTVASSMKVIFYRFSGLKKADCVAILTHDWSNISKQYIIISESRYNSSRPPKNTTEAESFCKDFIFKESNLGMNIRLYLFIYGKHPNGKKS